MGCDLKFHASDDLQERHVGQRLAGVAARKDIVVLSFELFGLGQDFQATWRQGHTVLFFCLHSFSRDGPCCPSQVKLRPFRRHDFVGAGGCQD